MAGKPHHKSKTVAGSRKERDIVVGKAVVVWGWTADGRQGWRLPGGGCTVDYVEALKVATRMSEVMDA